MEKDAIETFGRIIGRKMTEEGKEVKKAFIKQNHVLFVNLCEDISR